MTTIKFYEIETRPWWRELKPENLTGRWRFVVTDGGSPVLEIERKGLFGPVWVAEYYFKCEEAEVFECHEAA